MSFAGLALHVFSTWRGLKTDAAETLRFALACLTSWFMTLFLVPSVGG